MFKKKTDPENQIVVPAKVRKRARAALSTGDPTTWVDQSLFLIGQSVTHHRKGDQMLDEAVQAAESLLALLVEMRMREG